SELEKQNAKLDQLQKTIAEQQAALQALLEKLSVNKTENVPAGNQVAASPASIPGTASSAPAAQAQPQTPTVEQRLAKVEGQALKIGPLKVSGDFRLRWDGIFRSATEPGDPPVTHVQNARARYRFRINFDTDIYPTLSFHSQLATGPINNPLTLDQDFTAITARHHLFISDAWVDSHPVKELKLQAGRVVEVFADNSRFLFDDDIRFNGFNEKFVLPFSKGGNTNLELRAGQYFFSVPNVAVITPGSPLATAGAEIGTIGRSSNLFHQGLLFNLKVGEHWTHQFGGDVQVFREPNQIQLASTANGVVFIVQPGLGLALSGPMSGTGNATTTPSGAIYTAEDFHVARLTYRLNHTGFKVGEHSYPISFNLQGARNFGTDANERDAMLAALQVGRVTKRGDMSFLYVLSIKGANSIISQLTD